MRSSIICLKPYTSCVTVNAITTVTRYSKIHVAVALAEEAIDRCFAPLDSDGRSDAIEILRDRLLRGELRIAAAQRLAILRPQTS